MISWRTAFRNVRLPARWQHPLLAHRPDLYGRVVNGDTIVCRASLPPNVWLTPPGCHGNRVQGVGVQFKDDDSGALVRARIESLLSGQLQLNRPTHTL